MEAFATNTTVQRVEMVNALVTDALGQAWGGVLRQQQLDHRAQPGEQLNQLGVGALQPARSHARKPHTSTRLTCLYAAVGSRLLAEGLQENSSLRELKLANQRVSFTQQAEERLAAALESNFVVTCLTIDLRSTFARERIQRFLLRNQDELRLLRRRSTARVSLHDIRKLIYWAA